MGKISSKKIEEFAQQLTQLETIEFLGVVRLLNVPFYVDEGEGKVPRPFEDVFEDLCATYAAMPRVRRRNLQRILKPITKEEKKDKND